jgi:hypothetical protein
VLEYNPRPENLPLLHLAHVELLLVEQHWDELDALATTMRLTRKSSGASYLDAVADRAAGRVAAARGATAEGIRLLEAAAEAYDDAGMAVDGAVARLDAAEAALTAGRNEATASRLATAAVEAVRHARFRREIDRAESLLGRARP